jgi:hypothetical protein
MRSLCYNMDTSRAEWTVFLHSPISKVREPIQPVVGLNTLAEDQTNPSSSIHISPKTKIAWPSRCTKGLTSSYELRDLINICCGMVWYGMVTITASASSSSLTTPTGTGYASVSTTLYPSATLLLISSFLCCRRLSA